MMYAKLALRNVKRSAKDYLIYVITLILSVGLFYGFMSIASPYYNESLPVKINLEILNKAMRIAVPIVALLVVFLISYVNTYMLRRKQKEFAVQTIIGMEQRTVAFIFFVETMIMGAISIIFGILLGIGLSQIVGYIVVQSFGVEWQPYLSLFPDTILFTLLFFGAIFIVMGIRNIRTVRQLKIIDMLHNSQRGNEKFTLYHQLSRWIVIAVIASIAVLGMMFALIMKVSIQPHILWQFIALVIVATLSIVAAIWFFIECRHGKSGSIPLLFLTIPCFIQGIILLILNQVFESLVRQGLAIQAYYTMPPVLAIVLLAFSILALFSNMSWILTTTIKKPSDFYYQNLFVLGQIKSKMASSAKTMGVISCILILSIVLMAWLPVNAIRASEYQKITSPFDVQVLTTYSASSLEELPKTTLDYDYITKYLNENGYPLSKAATGQLYLLQADDIDKTVKNAPLLAISVDSYNQMRALSDLPEITLDSDEYGIAWSFDTLPETITQFNQEVSSFREIIGLSDDEFSSLSNNLLSEEISYQELVGKNGILIDDTAGMLKSWEDYSVALGDVVTIVSASGKKIELSVVGTIDMGDTDYNGTYFFVPENVLSEIYPEKKNFNTEFVINADVNQLPAAENVVLNAIGDNPDIQFNSFDDALSSIKMHMTGYQIPIYGLIVFIAIFGIINLCNTLMTNLVSRQQEFGVLQSIGLSNKQLYKMLRMECLYYVFGTMAITFVFGTAAGYILCQIFNQVGVFGKLHYTFPFLQVLLFFAVLVVIALIYSTLAIRYCHKQSLVDRIKTME